MGIQRFFKYIIGSPNVSDNPIPVTQAPKSSFQTMKTFTGTVALASTTTNIQALYTVTAGKTFYLTDISVCNNANNAVQASVNASATANTSPIIIGHSLNTAPFEVTNIGTEPSVAAGNPLTFQVTAQAATATTVTYFISGYEQ